MNEKKAKTARKHLKWMYEPASPIVTTRKHVALDALGVPFEYEVVNPIVYPANSLQRVYRDFKNGRR